MVLSAVRAFFLSSEWKGVKKDKLHHFIRIIPSQKVSRYLAYLVSLSQVHRSPSNCVFPNERCVDVYIWLTVSSLQKQFRTIVVLQRWKRHIYRYTLDFAFRRFNTNVNILKDPIIHRRTVHLTMFDSFSVSNQYRWAFGKSEQYVSSVKNNIQLNGIKSTRRRYWVD
jgi:hypothetical protein